MVATVASRSVVRAGTIVSGAPNIVWPTIPTPAAAGMLALQFELDESQWWDAETLAVQQYRQLAEVLAHARHTSPFYEARLDGFDLDGGVEPAEFAALTTLSRSDVQQHFDALRCRFIPPDHGDLVNYASSGSTGRPVRVLGTRLNDLWWRALILRDHLWHQREFNGTLAVLKTHSKVASRANWGWATQGVFETGPCLSLNSRHDIAEQADWLVAQDPDYLLSHASNLRALLRYCGEHGLRPRRLREVRSFGEMLPPDLRELCRVVWDVPLTDSYSAAEIGVIALQCPEIGHYHVQSEHVIVEILNEAGRACATGEIGRVMVTPLHNFAMPLVRYELNDYATPGPPCACGRGLPVLTRILGRRRNMLRLPDGTTHWPSIPAKVWDWASPVRQFQLVQAELAHITIRLVADRPLTVNEAGALYTRLNERLGWPFDYTIEYCAHIDAGPGFEDFLCLLDKET